MSDLVLYVKRLHPDAILPKRNSEGAAGYDLFSVEDVTVSAPQLGPTVIATGISVAIPPGHYGRIASRSSLSLKYGIEVGGGVIDADYRGEIKVLLHNHMMPRTVRSYFEVKKGDRIAQLIIEKIAIPEVVEEGELTATVRGEKGFGSTGR